MTRVVVIHEEELRKMESGEGRYRGVAEDLRERGERVLEKARSNAPVLSGAYRDGLHLEESVTDGVAEVRIAGSSDHDIYVEADTGNLAKALDAAAG